MSAPKLTEAQRYELNRLADPYSSMSFNVRSCRVLVRLGLAREVVLRNFSGSKDVVWRITDAGRAALKASS